MTTISQPRAIPVGHRRGTKAARRLGAALTRIAGWLGAARVRIATWLLAHVIEIGDASQLGPDPETEISRWTGGRV